MMLWLRLEQAAAGGGAHANPNPSPSPSPNPNPNLEQAAVGGGAHAVHVRAGRRAAILGVRLGDIGVTTRRRRGDNKGT